MTIRNVTIGDHFIKGKNTVCEVVDFYSVTSLITGKEIEIKVISRQLNGFATNKFEVCFSTVIRGKITKK